MFTGLVENICKVKQGYQSPGKMRLGIDLGGLAGETKIGDSVAVNGVCLTVAELQGSTAAFDVSAETLAKSTLAEVRPGAEVNVELALKAADRFGGHFVLGHTDGVATVSKIDKQSRFATIQFTAQKELIEQLLIKGSVAVDGISLTIAGLDRDSFSVALIPKTLEKTTLKTAKIGKKVNIEVDIITKTVQKQVKNLLSGQGNLTIEKLEEMGF